MTKAVDLPWSLTQPFHNINSTEEFAELAKEKVMKRRLFLPGVLEPTDLHATMRIENVTFENVSFAKTKLKRLRFKSCKFRKCLFIGTTISECDFYHCQFSLCNFYKVRLFETHIDPKLISDCMDKKDHTNIALNLYSEIRKSALQLENPEFASEAGYQYQRWNRYHMTYKFRSGDLPWYEFALRWMANLMFDYIVGYGWRIRRFALSTAILIIFLTAWNYIFWCNLTGNNAIIGSPSIIKSLYYTVITITTLGYGDITPATAWGMLSASGQTAIGVVWIGLLVSIIVRKVLP